MINETMGKVKFQDLDIRAKLNCMEQFVNVIVPYADYDMVDDGFGCTDMECVVCDIEEWVGEQFYFDRDGNWYDEGRMVR